MALLGAGIGAPTTVMAQEPLTVIAGVGDGTVAGQAFGPGDFSVSVGDSVTFSIGSDEPHTVTFGAGPADVPPPFWPIAGFAQPSEEAASAPPPYDLGTATYDGSGFVNTGFLVGKGSTATVQFEAPGTFPFFCSLHPGMAGQVTVVEDGATTTPDEAASAAAATSDALLAQVEPLREERLAATSTTENDDGSSTWNVFVDAVTAVDTQPGGGSGYLELLEFTPAQIEIEPGDTIHWTAAQVHTVTFMPEGTDAEALFPSDEALLAPIGGTTYDGTEVVHSGILGFPTGPDSPPVTEFSVTFPTPGVYPFFCALHAQLGQVGVVTVTGMFGWILQT